MASEKKITDAFEAALKRELRASTAQTPECIAPDILAAHYDRTILSAERARVESHLASCARCQAMMASIARADDANSSSPPESVRGFFWFVRVATPIAAIGAVIAFAFGLHHHAAPQPEVIALASPAVQSKARAEERAAPPAWNVASQPQSAPPPQPAVAEARDAAAPILHHRRVEAKSADAPPNGSPDVAAEGANTAGQLYAEAATQKMQQPSRAASAPAMAAGNSAAPLSSLHRMATSNSAKQVVSPDAKVAWQFGSNGEISRFTSPGVWVRQRSGVTTDLLAGSAPSRDVCWIVGKSGTIVRTLDGGVHWLLVTPPSRDNFTAIVAADSNNATVTTMSGRRDVTRDGGVTWSAL